MSRTVAEIVAQYRYLEKKQYKGTLEEQEQARKDFHSFLKTTYVETHNEELYA